MKFKLPLIVFFIIAFLFYSVFPASAEIKGDYVKQDTSYIGKYQTDLFTGNASYSYPIKVPKGTNDLTPEVSLSYNNSAAYSFSSIVGTGWNINTDYIERDVNYTPGNSSTGDDKFKLHFKGNVYDLVYVPSENRYHTKQESYLHIQKLTSTQNQKGEYWEIKTQDGTKYIFGKVTNAEHMCRGQDYVNHWKIEQVQDIHGNTIKYTYIDGDGYSYIDKIEYNNSLVHKIEFTYSNIPFLRWQENQGCDWNEPYRLNSILVKTNNNLVRQYDFSFTLGDSNQSLLTSITEKGSDGSSLTPTTFTYRPEIHGWNTTEEKWINNVNLDTHLEQGDVTMADVNGDGYVDIVKTINHGGPTVSWKVLFNQGGNGWSTQFQTWVNSADLDAAHLNRTDVRLIDVTGDSLPDIVKASSSNSWKVWRNTGSSWNTTVENWGNISSYTGAHLGGTGNDSAQLVDVTGDGLPDIVNTWWNGGQEWRVFRNTGSGWSGTPEVWSHQNNGGYGHGLDSNDTYLVDANNDGLVDIVSSTYSGDNQNSTDTWRVWRNTGDSWRNSNEVWINNANVTAHLGMENIGINDVNGDGLPDIVKVVDQGLNDEWRVLLNKGNFWSTEWVVWIPYSAGMDIDFSGEDNVRIIDVDGDGLSDIVQTKYSGVTNTWNVYKNNGDAPKMLSSIILPQGGLINFDYIPSTTFDNTGADDVSDLRSSMWLVQKKTESNGMVNSHQTVDITTYTYKDGMYDFGDKEFRGFNSVDEIASGSAKKKYVFNQDDALRGMLAEVQTRDLQDNPYVETENTWSSTSSNGIYTAKLDKETQYTYDGTASNPKVEETEFTYDTYGNIIKQSEKGDTSTTIDDRFTYNEYTINTSSWIVNTLRHTYKHASNDSTKVSESWFYYDNNTWIDDAPTKGDLTKEVKWLQGGTSPTTLFAYDTYGNRTQVTDANNHQMTYTFDSTGTYPTSITNAKNQTTVINYDLATGNLLSKTDPNGNTTTYLYDVFGRITKEIKPSDTSEYPTTQYTYLIDGIAPEGIRISKREVSSSSATLDTFTFSDGLGRTIQTRHDAEDTSKQIVTDTFYDTTGEVKKETVPYHDSASVTTLPTPTPPPATKFGDGSNGDVAIFSNVTETPIDSSVNATASTTTATVGQGLNFAPNQIVFFHQTQGTNAGKWEFARVEDYSGTTLTLTTALTNSYSSSGNNRAQVRVVPQYNNVTVYSGGTWTAKPWNGYTGGILAVLVKGTLTVNGTITATGKGFRGGVEGHDDHGWTGEGTTFSVENIADPVGNGGGSSHVSSAGGGHAETIYGNEGTIGSSEGTSDLTTMVFGGGGAGGSSYNTDGAGGIGGGIVFVSSKTISVNGQMTSAGTNGGNTMNGRPGAGGAGGSILLKSQNVALGSNLVTTPYGNAGIGGGDPRAVRGSVGRIRVAYENSVTGSTNPTASTAQEQVPLIPAGLVATTASISASGVYVDPDPSAKYTEYTYDPASRVTIVKNPKGDTKTIAYDHWKETTIDENGHIKREYNNAFDKIVKVEEVMGASNSATIYSYDALDQLTQIVDDLANIFAFTYDTLGRKISQTDPDMGTWTYEYDGVGNLTKQKDNRNIEVTKTYDEINRLTKTDYPTQADNTFLYDANGKIGTLSIATDSAGTVKYQYDNRLRKTQEQRSVNGTTKTTQFSYDSADRMVTQTNPDGEVVTYAFNPQGEIDSVTGTTGIVDNIDYNALGKITKKDFANGKTTNYTYNTTDFRLNRIQTGTIQDLNYTYDNVGNIATIADNVTSKTQTFTYDDLDRLVTASESAGYNYAYEYNSIGNLTKFTDGGSATTYSYGQNAGPHALTSSSGASSSGQQSQQSTTTTFYASEDTYAVSTDPTSNFGTDTEIGSDGDPVVTNYMKFDLSALAGKTVTNAKLRVYVANGSTDTHAIKEVSTNSWSATTLTYNNRPSLQTTIGSFTNPVNINTWYEVDITTAVAAKVGQTYSIGMDSSSVDGFWFNSNEAGSNKEELVITYSDSGGSTPTPTPTGSATATPTPTSSITNIATNGTAYRWWGLSSSTSNSNKETAAGLNDVNYTTDVALADEGDDENEWEAAGVTFSTTQEDVTTVTYKNGSHLENEYGNGVYAANFKLQFTTDGSTWTDSGWTSSPSYHYNSSQAEGTTYTFTGTATDIRGARVVGQVHVDEGSWYVLAREIEIFNQSSSSSTPTPTPTGTVTPTPQSAKLQATEDTYADAVNASTNYGSDTYIGSDGDTVRIGYMKFNLTSLGGKTVTNAKLRIYISNGSIDTHRIKDVSTNSWAENTLTYNNRPSLDSTIVGTLTNPVNINTWYEIDITSAVASRAGQIYSLGIDSTGSDGLGFNSRDASSNKEELVITYTDGSTSTPTPTATVTPTPGTPQAGTYTYDANGNMTSDGVKCYQYNEANQLDKVKKCSNNQTIAEYVYDYKGNRMVKKNFSNGTLANTVVSWSDSYETKIIEGGATENTAYYFANGQLIAKKDKNGNKTYIHSDHLGSTSVVTNQAGSLVEETKYDPGGKVKSGGTANKFLYTGQEHDGETGLHYYGARYYNPQIRRFTQPDDIIQNVYNPQDLNRYSYVRNNPLRYIDPSGNVVTCTKNGCSSSYTVLNRPQPQKQSSVISKATPYYSAVKAAPAPQRQTSQGNGGGGNSGSNGGSSGGNSGVAGASTNNQPKQQDPPKRTQPNILTLRHNMYQASFFRHLPIKDIWFANKVRPGGDWDYKTLDPEQTYADFGNFNYGLTGSAAGYDPLTLQSMAGVIQQGRELQNILNNDPVNKTAGIPFLIPPYGDTVTEQNFSQDQYMIMQGISYYGSPW